MPPKNDYHLTFFKMVSVVPMRLPIDFGKKNKEALRKSVYESGTKDCIRRDVPNYEELVKRCDSDCVIVGRLLSFSFDRYYLISNQKDAETMVKICANDEDIGIIFWLCAPKSSTEDAGH